MSDTLLNITIALCVGIFIGGLIGTIFEIGYKNDIEELGTAICLENYNMDFDKYEDGELSCKPIPIEETYDGIIIKIGDEIK